MMSKNLAHLAGLHKKNLIDIYKHAVEAVKPENLLRDSIKLENDTLIVNSGISSTQDGQVRIDLRERNIHVLGGGKCVLSMARGLATVFSLDRQAPSKFTGSFSHGCLSLPIGLRDLFEADIQTKSLLGRLSVECLFGSENNLPDEDSIKASESLLSRVVDACRKGQMENRRPLFIVLISGGGSACLSSPKHISLAKKLELIRQLVENGATIVELNKVRRYFSNIKGGNLARHILRNNPGAQVLTLLLSDVIGDPIEFIASGPTYLDGNESSSTRQQHYLSMCNVLDKYNLSLPPNLMIADEASQVVCVESNASQKSVINRVIGSNRKALDAVMLKAQSLGYSTRSLGAAMQGSTGRVVEEILNSLDELDTAAARQHPILVCCGGETTVERRADETWGKGGRVQEMALDYMIAKLTRFDKPDVLSGSLASTGDAMGVLDYFLAGATDGQDGPTDVAACLASLCEFRLSTSWANGSERPLASVVGAFDLKELQLVKRRHDSYNFWETTKPEWLVRTGLTGTNVMDLYLYLVDAGLGDYRSL